MAEGRSQWARFCRRVPRKPGTFEVKHEILPFGGRAHLGFFESERECRQAVAAADEAIHGCPRHEFLSVPIPPWIRQSVREVLGIGMPREGRGGRETWPSASGEEVEEWQSLFNSDRSEMNGVASNTNGDGLRDELNLENERAAKLQRIDREGSSGQLEVQSPLSLDTRQMQRRVKPKQKQRARKEPQWRRDEDKLLWWCIQEHGKNWLLASDMINSSIARNFWSRRPCSCEERYKQLALGTTEAKEELDGAHVIRLLCAAFYGRLEEKHRSPRRKADPNRHVDPSWRLGKALFATWREVSPPALVSELDVSCREDERCSPNPTSWEPHLEGRSVEALLGTSCNSSPALALHFHHE